MKRVSGVILLLISVMGCVDKDSQAIRDFVMNNKDEFIGGTMINEVSVSNKVVFLDFYDTYEAAVEDFPYLGSMGNAKMFQDLFKDTNLELLITDAASSTFLAFPEVQTVRMNIDCRIPPLNIDLSRSLFAGHFAKSLGAELNSENWKKDRDQFRAKVLYNEVERKAIVAKLNL